MRILIQYNIIFVFVFDFYVDIISKECMYVYTYYPFWYNIAYVKIYEMDKY